MTEWPMAIHAVRLVAVLADPFVLREVLVRLVDLLEHVVAVGVLERGRC